MKPTYDSLRPDPWSYPLVGQIFEAWGISKTVIKKLRGHFPKQYLSQDFIAELKFRIAGENHAVTVLSNCSNPVHTQKEEMWY